jgi:type IV pilus assembly protein PilO
MSASLESMLKLPTPQKVAIVAGISLIILLVYWFRFYQPKIQRIVAEESKLADLTHKMKEKEIIADNYEKFKEEMTTKQEKLRRSVAELPDQKEIPDLLKNISNMSQKAELEVQLFKPLGEQPAQFYSRVPVELKFTGSYHEIGMFFYYVGKLPRIVNIENFSIKNAQKTQKDELVLSTSCVATTYRYVESAPKPPQGKK